MEVASLRHLIVFKIDRIPSIVNNQSSIDNGQFAKLINCILRKASYHKKLRITIMDPEEML